MSDNSNIDRIGSDDRGDDHRRDEDGDNDSLSMGSPGGWFVGARGRSTTYFLYVTVLAAGGYVGLWIHDQNTRDRSSATQTFIANQTHVIERVEKAVRFKTCIDSRPEADRRAEFDVPTSFCNRLSQ